MFRLIYRLPPGEEICVWQKSHTPWLITESEPTWYLPYKRRKPCLFYELAA